MLSFYYFFVLAILFSVGHGKNVHTTVEAPAVTNFREYLRINSAHPVPDYAGCISWLRKQAEDIGLDFHLAYFDEPTQFAVWLTWNGTDPSLKSILVNSHMDVVAVDHSKWEHDPFEAFKDEQGNIFARGTIDMKSATVAVLEAIRRLKAQGFTPLRTVHVSVIPDEEITGNLGMKIFVKSPEFENLNVAFDIDETGPSTESNEMFISYGEKSIWQFNYTARGMAAHASELPETTAGQKLQVVIQRLHAYRDSQWALLQTPGMTLENVTTLNLVRMGGGTGNNIIPDELWASWDMRIRLKDGWNFTDVENMLDEIAAAAGEGVSYTFISKAMDIAETPADDTNVWWVELQKICQSMSITCTPTFKGGVTDAKYVRSVGIPAFGVNTFLNTEPLAHQDNERINENEFLNGIDRYGTIIKGISSVPETAHR